MIYAVNDLYAMMDSIMVIDAYLRND